MRDDEYRTAPIPGSRRAEEMGSGPMSRRMAWHGNPREKKKTTDTHRNHSWLAALRRLCGHLDKKKIKRFGLSGLFKGCFTPDSRRDSSFQGSKSSPSRTMFDRRRNLMRRGWPTRAGCVRVANLPLGIERNAPLVSHEKEFCSFVICGISNRDLLDAPLSDPHVSRPLL